MEKTARKKIRLTLSRRIAVLFLIASVLAGGIVLNMSYNYLFDGVVRENSDVAQAALIGAASVIWAKDPQLTLLTDKEQAEKVHMRFRDICQSTGLKFLCLYTLEGEGAFRYIVCAGNTDEDDKWINASYGFGGMCYRDMYDAEKEALNGNPDAAHEFTNDELGHVCIWVTPLLTREGEVKALIGASYDMELIFKHTYFNLIVFGIAGLIANFLTFIVLIFLVRQVALNPIKKLSEKMLLFTRTKKAGPVSSRSTLFSDEITDIEDSFNSMAQEIETYISDIEELTKERVMNQTQLDVARKIQLGIVPVTTELGKDYYDISGFSRPAKEVGGDFYGVFEITRNRVCVVIGDVSGKGISAALFMMMIKSAIREKIKAGNPPDRALCQVNDDICLSNPQNMFATVFVAVLDYKRGIVNYANAGHNAPILIGKEVSELEVDHGIALGLFEGADITLQSIELKSGEGIFLYTDGFTENINREKEQFGTARLKQVIEGISKAEDKLSAAAVTKAVKDSADEFSQGLEQFDDMTCVSMIYHQITARKTDLLPDIRQVSIIRDKLLETFADENNAKKAILACEEIFVNIVNYSGARKISMEICRQSDSVKTVFTDDGKEFDPVSYSVPVGEFDMLDQGGMGISFAKQTSDKMVYNRDKGKNVLTLVFDNN